MLGKDFRFDVTDGPPWEQLPQPFMHIIKKEFGNDLDPANLNGSSRVVGNGICDHDRCEGGEYSPTDSF